MKKTIQSLGSLKLLEYFKHLAWSIKISTLKFFTFHKQKAKDSASKSQKINNFPKNILNKIYRSYTRNTNSYFLLSIIIAILTAITFSYYMQNSRFNQQLQSKAESTRLHIEKTIKDYHSSLDIIVKIIIDEKRYLDHDKVLRLLKLTYTTDENIKLFPVTWHPLSDPNYAYSAFGPFPTQQNEQFIQRLSKSLEPLYIYNKSDISGENGISIIVPVATNQSNKIIKSNLVGYLTLSIKISALLQNMQYIVKDDDLIKFSVDGETSYYSQKNGHFEINRSSDINGYKFADKVSFASSLYKVSVGSNKQQIATRTIENAKLSCAIILCLGGLMLVIYNLTERRKFKKSYHELSIDELASLERQVEHLSLTLALAEEKTEQLAKQNQNYLESINAINSLEKQIKQGFDTSLVKIKDSNHLLLKHYSKEKELKPVILEKIFAEIYQRSEDLLHNIVASENHITEVNLIDVFDQALTIFAPVITARSITIINKIDKLTIKINELIFKQIIISLLARSLYLAPLKSSVEISAYNDKDKTAAAIEISDNSMNVDENILNDILQQNNDYSLPGMARIQLELKSIIDLIKQTLLGDISITNTHSQGKHTALLLPIEYNRSDKVINFIKIAR
jgi:hypothetical protein